MCQGQATLQNRDTYGHLFPGQEAQTVGRLPDMLGDDDKSMRATGTENGQRLGQRAPDFYCANLKATETTPVASGEPQGFVNGTFRRDMTTPDAMPPEGLEPSTDGLRVRCSAN